MTDGILPAVADGYWYLRNGRAMRSILCKLQETSQAYPMSHDKRIGHGGSRLWSSFGATVRSDRVIVCQKGCFFVIVDEFHKTHISIW